MIVVSTGSGGVAYSKSVYEEINNADLVFGVGASFTATGFGIRFPTKDKEFVHNTNEPGDINKNIPTNYPLLGDSKLTLSMLHEALKDRLKGWPARFLLMMTIGEAGDAFDDPTKPWPATRKRVVMGTLTLREVAEDQDQAGERLSFNPNRLARGIEPSGDPILEARLGAYEASRDMRGGCPFKWRADDAK